MPVTVPADGSTTLIVPDKRFATYTELPTSTTPVGRLPTVTVCETVFVAVAMRLNVPSLKFGTNNCDPSGLNAAASGCTPTGIVATTTGGLCVRSMTLTLFEP